MKRRRFHTIELAMDIPIKPAEVKRFRYALKAAFHNAVGIKPLVAPAMGFRWQTHRRAIPGCDAMWTWLWRRLYDEKLIAGLANTVILESSLHEAPKGLLELHFRTEG